MSNVLVPQARLGTAPLELVADRAEPTASARSEAAPDEPPSARRRRLPTLSCIVPSRNEADNLARLLPMLADALGSCSSDWEVIVVDDGSTDSTPRMMLTWTRRSGFRLLQLSRNFGKEAALTAGMQAASGDVVVMMDADLQHPPAMIARFVRHWQRGADVVYAQREGRGDESAFKRWGAGLFYSLVNAASRVEVPAGAGDFRLMDRSVVQALLLLPERNRFMKGLYAWVGFRTVAVPYMPDERAHGRSNFSALRLIKLSLDGLTAFTTWPLRAVSAFGFGLAIAAFCYGGFLSLDYLIRGHNVSGWTTIVVSLMLFSGIQLISLGVVGEYVGRVFEEVKARPLYVVRQRLGTGLSDVER